MEEACVVVGGVDVAVVTFHAQLLEGDEGLPCCLIYAVEVCSDEVGALLVVEDGVVFGVAEADGLVEIHRWSVRGCMLASLRLTKRAFVGTDHRSYTALMQRSPPCCDERSDLFVRPAVDGQDLIDQDNTIVNLIQLGAIQTHDMEISWAMHPCEQYSQPRMLTQGCEKACKQPTRVFS